MEQGTTAKLCECGCGLPAPIATQTRSRRGYVKGQPMRFVNGHGAKGHRQGPRRTVFVETGQHFGRGVVIEAETRIRIDDRRTIRAARLLCDCGNDYYARMHPLVSGGIKSCGCLARDRSVDRTGQRYGKLVVTERAGRRGSNALWRCVCDCGTGIIVGSRSLSIGEAKSCGCSRRKPRDPDAPQRAARNRVLQGYRKAADSRGLVWALTGEDFDLLTSQDCHYCGQPPVMVRRAGLYDGGAFTYNGIDRVDNALGYIAGNVVPCCKICNNAKRDMPLEDFMAWIARLTVKQQRAAEFTTTFLQTWIPVIMMASAAQQQEDPG